MRVGIHHRLAALVPLILLAESVGGVAAGAAAPSPPLIGIRLVDVPADLNNDPRAQLYIIDHVAPGTMIHRRVEVSSTSDEPTAVAVYAGAASITANSFIGAAAPGQDELSGWISLDRSTVSLPPHGRAVVEVTIVVPPRASTGERYAVVWASVSSSPAASGAVLLVDRVGIRVYLDVGPGGDPPSDFQIENIAGARTADGRPKAIARVHNTGLRALDISGDLWLSDGPGSLSAGPFTVATGSTLAPGATAPVEVPMDRRLPDGPWTVRLTLASGRIQRSATATIRFPTAPGSENAPVRPETIAWPPILGGAGILALAALVVFFFFGRRGRLIVG